MDSNGSKKLFVESDLFGPNEDVFKLIQATEIEYISNHLGVRKLLDENGRIQLDVVIDSKTSYDELAKSINVILTRRRQLTKIQGRDFCDYIVELMYQVDQETFAVQESVSIVFPFLQKKRLKKPTVPDLTFDTNFTALVFLLGSINHPKDFHFQAYSKRLFNSLIELFPQNTDTEEPSMSYESFIESLKNNVINWDIREEPIHVFQMREKIRNLKASNELPSLHLLEGHSKERLMRVYLLYIKSLDWQTAMELLQKTYPDLHNKYRSHLDARTNEILSFSSTR